MRKQTRITSDEELQLFYASFVHFVRTESFKYYIKLVYFCVLFFKFKNCTTKRCASFELYGFKVYGCCNAQWESGTLLRIDPFYLIIIHPFVGTIINLPLQYFLLLIEYCASDVRAHSPLAMSFTKCRMLRYCSFIMSHFN